MPRFAELARWTLPSPIRRFSRACSIALRAHAPNHRVMSSGGLSMHLRMMLFLLYCGTSANLHNTSGSALCLRSQSSAARRPVVQTGDDTSVMPTLGACTSARSGGERDLPGGTAPLGPLAANRPLPGGSEVELDPKRPNIARETRQEGRSNAQTLSRKFLDRTDSSGLVTSGRCKAQTSRRK